MVHEHLRPVPLLERAIDGHPEDAAREVSLYLTWLAEALIERAEATLGRAVDLAGGAGSARSDTRVQEIQRQLVLAWR